MKHSEWCLAQRVTISWKKRMCGWMRVAPTLNTVSGCCLQKRILSGDKLYNDRLHVVSFLGLFFFLVNSSNLGENPRWESLSKEVIFNVTRLQWGKKKWKVWICNNHLQMKDCILGELNVDIVIQLFFHAPIYFTMSIFKWNSLS